MALTALRLKTLTKPGLHADGHNLYLQIRGPEQKSWAFRFMLNGKARKAGLGPYPLISLSEARVKAEAWRKLLLDGVDPLEKRKVDKATAAAARASAITFSAAADACATSKGDGWRSDKHRAQWRTTLTMHADPVIGKLPITDVTTSHMLQILQPIWATKTETAVRVRGRVESVLDYAKTLGWRGGENPARWRGHLDNLLSAPSKIAKVKHHPALPWQQAPAFMARLREVKEISARALEFAILTGCRTGEVRLATWSEVDLEAKVWTVPAERMKGGEEHRVPLSAPALETLAAVRQLRGGPLFPGRNLRSPMGENGLTYVLTMMGRDDLTVHGFRSTFRTWSAAATDTPREVCEAALAHVTGKAVERAYQRSDVFEKRRQLMDAWAAFLAPEPVKLQLVS
jgi:integrase